MSRVICLVYMNYLVTVPACLAYYYDKYKPVMKENHTAMNMEPGTAELEKSELDFDHKITEQNAGSAKEAVDTIRNEHATTFVANQGKSDAIKENSTTITPQPGATELEDAPGLGPLMAEQNANSVKEVANAVVKEPATTVVDDQDESELIKKSETVMNSQPAATPLDASALGFDNEMTEPNTESMNEPPGIIEKEPETTIVDSPAVMEEKTLSFYHENIRKIITGIVKLKLLYL